ncbi:MAG: CAAX prenyl protease-related protein [Gallionellaceae bacterium]|nr:CAAX prenyl protease-related protein [Gallionellaceae bacterium]
MPEHAMWYRIAPFAAYVFFMLLADLLSILGWNSYELRWLYAVKIMVVVILLWKLSGHYKELALPRFISWNTWAIAVLAGVGIFLAWINLTTDWMVTGQSAGFDPRQNNAISPALALMRWSGAALVIPVMEELFWRSFVLRWLSQANFLALDPAQVSWRAFVLTAVLFAVQHHLWLAGLMAGMAYGALYMYSRSLWPAIVAHAVTNFLLGGWILYTGNWNFW